MSSFTPVPDIEKIGTLTEWRKVWGLFPPCFYDVWVTDGKKKFKAFLDSPNRRWCKSKRVEWELEPVKNICGWKLIKSRPFEKQKEEIIKFKHLIKKD